MIRPKNIMVTIEKIAVGAKPSIKILVVQSSCIWCEDLKKTLLACGIVQSKYDALFYDRKGTLCDSPR